MKNPSIASASSVEEGTPADDPLDHHHFLLGHPYHLAPPHHPLLPYLSVSPCLAHSPFPFPCRFPFLDTALVALVLAPGHNPHPPLPLIALVDGRAVGLAAVDCGASHDEVELGSASPSSGGVVVSYHFPLANHSPYPDPAHANGFSPIHGYLRVR